MKGLKPASARVQPSPCHNCYPPLDFERALVAPFLFLSCLKPSLLGPPCLVSIVSFAWLPVAPLSCTCWSSAPCLLVIPSCSTSLLSLLLLLAAAAGLELPLCCFATRVRRKRACRACSPGSLAFRDPLLLWALSLDMSIHVGNVALPDGYLSPCHSCSLIRLFARCSLLMFFLICLLRLTIRFTHLVEGRPASLIFVSCGKRFVGHDGAGRFVGHNAGGALAPTNLRRHGLAWGAREKQHHHCYFDTTGQKNDFFRKEWFLVTFRSCRLALIKRPWP